MFSVLIRYQKTRREVLLSAKSVEFVPPRTELENEDAAQFAGLLINHGVEEEEGCHISLTPKGNSNWRDVFVMNDQGQTVARYTV